jgi:hypothetical protein
MTAKGFCITVSTHVQNTHTHPYKSTLPSTVTGCLCGVNVMFLDLASELYMGKSMGNSKTVTASALWKRK